MIFRLSPKLDRLFPPVLEVAARHIPMLDILLRFNNGALCVALLKEQDATKRLCFALFDMHKSGKIGEEPLTDILLKFQAAGAQLYQPGIAETFHKAFQQGIYETFLVVIGTLSDVQAKETFTFTPRKSKSVAQRLVALKQQEGAWNDTLSAIWSRAEACGAFSPKAVPFPVSV